MAEFLALLAATAFALGTVLQQKGTLQTDAGAGDARFLVEVFRRPVWLCGGLLQAAGWVLQAFALHIGSLVVVQSLTTLSTVIALPFGAWLTDQRITRQVWIAASTLVAGLVVFLSVGTPGQGTGTPSADAWWSAGLVTLGLVVLLVRWARHEHGGIQALLYGSAAGLAFGLQAAVTKVFTDQVGNGIAAIVTGWEVYVLVACALVGFALQQSALRTGALAPAMAAANAMTLFASVALGLTVFDERVQSAGGRMAGVVVGLALALVGVMALARAPLPEADGQRTETGGRRSSGASGTVVRRA